jgi:membrane protein
VTGSPWSLGGLSVRQLAARVWAELLILTVLVGMLPVGGLLDRLLVYAARVLPADAMSVLTGIVTEIVRGAGGGLLSAGVAGALWGASRAAQSIILALNVVYDVRRPRPWWRRQVVSLLLTVTFSLFTLAGLGLLVFGERIGRVLAEQAGLGSVFSASWAVLHWVTVVVLLLTALDLVYHLAPNVRQRWHWLTPGSAFALAAWLLASIGLRLYVTHVPGYNAIYGSIGGVILLLLWLYASSVALLVGGQINAVIARAAAARDLAAPLDDPPRSGD